MRFLDAGWNGRRASSRFWDAAGQAAYPFVKRLIDILVAGLGLALGWPLLLLIGGLVRADSPGPALYRQARVGRDGRIFRMLKFRTMRVGAEDELEDLLAGDPRAQLDWLAWRKLLRDPRLTRMGRVLRRLSLDELPQLWNVLRGEMSVVGPRPILPGQRGAYGPAISAYETVRPGLTGMWQVSGRNRLSFAERVKLDQRYLEARSFWLDLVIMMRTARAVLSTDGAF